MEEIFFKKALELAQKGIGFTSPNPCVGAVVVQDGKSIGEGYHRKAGTAHAEVHAIQNAHENGFSTEGADIYVTLEPCCHVGKTPACTDLLIRSGIKRVFIAMQDPFKLVNGGGIKILQEHGIHVEVLDASHPLSQEIRLFNQPFIKWALTGLPYVTLKAAVSLDGKIATRDHDSKWITGEETRKDSRMERSICDAVLVGSGTVKYDDPELAPHGEYQEKILKRIIIDPDLSTSIESRVYRDKEVFIATTDKASEEKRKEFESRGLRVESLGRERILLKNLIQRLGKMNIQHVFVEGGSTVHGSFFDEALFDPLVIDKIIWYIAPKLVGGVSSISAIGGVGIEKMNQAVTLQNVTMEKFGDDMKVSGFLNVY